MEQQAELPQSPLQLDARRTHLCVGSGPVTNPGSAQNSASAASAGTGCEEVAAHESAASASLEVRVSRLEAMLAAQQAKIEEVEKLARKKGTMMQLITEYGLPFAFWYCTCWASTWFGIYMLLESGVISWQDSLRPLLEGFGLEYYTDRIDPSMGNVIIAFMVNELVEPLRFPFVLVTGKPVVKALRQWRSRHFPSKVHQ
eukprot:CAMPEP_0169206486 /NCGR_PEP_ID=MMETSP1016-20121227/13067_1 /TAXON_ID=342587 /ORGANISM="Karlodinium micrum, Strain CCMP2283" /LENGTH=199 /DNA_ID=CAMNT_0009283683 /DNA_START=70 /DNA_END=667 /DNA_ORIENTATION=-